MVNCEECGKELRMLQGYRHPALGVRFLVCGNCFTKIDEDMQRWRRFYLSNSFNAESTKSDVHTAWNKNISNDFLLQQWFSTLWAKLESQKFMR